MLGSFVAAAREVRDRSDKDVLTAPSLENIQSPSSSSTGTIFRRSAVHKSSAASPQVGLEHRRKRRQQNVNLRTLQRGRVCQRREYGRGVLHAHSSTSVAIRMLQRHAKMAKIHTTYSFSKFRESVSTAVATPLWPHRFGQLTDDVLDKNVD